MKKYCTILLTVLLTVCAVSSAPLSAASGSGLVWLVEPVMEYEKVYYCGACNLLGNEPKGNINVGDEKYTGTDVADIIEYIKKYNFNNIVYIGVGHGYGTSEYFYDEEKDIFVEYVGGDTNIGIKFYTPTEFADIWCFHYNYVTAVRKTDSEKAIMEEFTSNFDYSYTGDKYALIYNGEFISDFIYDGYEHRGDQYFVPEMTRIKLRNRWGVVGKTGATLLPFIFDDIEFFSDGAAFAKYNGKYGILDLNATIAAYAESPATEDIPPAGREILIYLLCLAPVIAMILYIFCKERKNKNEIFPHR